MEFLNKLSTAVLILIAGVIGAALGLLIETEIRTARQRIAYFIGGVSCAFYFAEPIADWLEITKPSWLMAIGFGLGLFGMALLQRVKHSIDNLDIGAIVAARFRDVIAAIRGSR